MTIEIEKIRSTLIRDLTFAPPKETQTYKYRVEGQFFDTLDLAEANVTIKEQWRTKIDYKYVEESMSLFLHEDGDHTIEEFWAWIGDEKDWENVISYLRWYYYLPRRYRSWTMENIQRTLNESSITYEPGHYYYFRFKEEFCDCIDCSAEQINKLEMCRDDVVEELLKELTDKVPKRKHDA